MVDGTMASGASYTRTAIALHWFAALLIVCNLALGVSMVDLELSPLKLRLFSYHKWIGITVFLVASLRLAWRQIHPPPPPVPMPDWQRRAAAATHAALYVLMFAIPLSGWIYSSSTGVSVVYLGLVPLPDHRCPRRRGAPASFRRSRRCIAADAAVPAAIVASVQHMKRNEGASAPVVRGWGDSSLSP